MMFKRCLSLVVLTLWLGTLSSVHFAQVQASTSRVLILYQERNFFADKRDTVEVLAELLSAYEVDVSEQSIADVAQINLDNYDAVMVIALDQHIESDVLIQKLTAFNGHIIWLGGSVTPLLKTGNYPLAYKGENYQYVYVTVSNGKQAAERTFLIGEKRLFFEMEPLSEQSRVFSWLSDGKNRSPFIVTAQNLTYVSRVDMNEPLFFIFAEYLSRLFPRKALPDAALMVSIQDVHGFTDQTELRKLADQFYALNMPFNVQVIPFFKVSGSKKVYRYDEIPQFVETLRYLESRGGSLIVESVPVALSENEVNAIGYPEVLGTQADGLKAYLNQSFLAMAIDGLKPLGFSSPHANLSAPELSDIRAHINTFIGIRYITEGQSVIYPYVLENAKGFERFYPLNLGYLDYSKPAIWSSFEETFDKIALVNNAFYGIYLTPDTPIAFLEELDSFAKRKGLTYFNLQDEPVKIAFSDVSFDAEGLIPYTYRDPQTNKSPLQQFIGLFANGVLLILALGVTIFGFIYRRSLKRTRALARKE